MPKIEIEVSDEMADAISEHAKVYREQPEQVINRWLTVGNQLSGLDRVSNMFTMISGEELDKHNINQTMAGIMTKNGFPLEEVPKYVNDMGLIISEYRKLQHLALESKNLQSTMIVFEYAVRQEYNNKKEQ